MSEPAAASPMRVESQRSWTAYSALIALLLATFVLLWPTVSTLIEEWEDTNNLTYTHGYLIALVSAWLLWRARPLAENVSVRPEPRMLVPIAALSFAWLLGYRAGLEIAHQLLLPMLGWCVVFAVFGWQVARRCAFAFGYLYFAVPIWSLGNEALQSLTVVIVRGLLTLTGIPAYVTGNFVHIPSGVFEIAGGCSGLHFFIVALAIGFLYGEIHKDTWRVRLLTILFSMALALITNWIRVFTLIVLGHATQMQHYLVSVEHYKFGWVLFAAAMLIFFFVTRYLPTAAESSDSQAPANELDTPRVPVPVLVAALAVLSIGPVWLALAPQAKQQSMQSDTFVAVDGWQGPIQTSATDWVPVYDRADSKTMVEYQKASLRAQVFVATYLEQHQGKELIGYDSSMIGSNVSMTDLQRLESDGLNLNVQHVTTRDGRRALIVYYYEIGRTQTASGRAAQLLYGWQSLFHVPASKAVGAYAVCTSECEAEQLELMSLLTKIRGGRD